MVDDEAGEQQGRVVEPRQDPQQRGVPQMPDEPAHREVVAAVREDEGDPYDDVVVQSAHDPGDPARVDVVAAAGRELGREPLDDVGGAARFEASGEGGGELRPECLLRDARGDPRGQQLRLRGDAVEETGGLVEQRGDGSLAEGAHVLDGQLFEERQLPWFDIQQAGELEDLGPAAQCVHAGGVSWLTEEHPAEGFPGQGRYEGQGVLDGLVQPGGPALPCPAQCLCEGPGLGVVQ